MVKILIFQFYFLALHFLSVFSSKIPDRTDGLRSGEFRQVRVWLSVKNTESQTNELQSFRSKCVFWNIFSLLRNISSLLTNFSILLWIFLACRESFPVCCEIFPPRCEIFSRINSGKCHFLWNERSPYHVVNFFCWSFPGTRRNTPNSFFMIYAMIIGIQ